MLETEKSWQLSGAFQFNASRIFARARHELSCLAQAKLRHAAVVGFVITCFD